MPIQKVSRELGEEGNPTAFKIDIANFKGDNAYPTGGYPGIANALGVGTGKLIALVPLSHQGFIWDYDPGVDKLIVRGQPAAAAVGQSPEIPGGTNLSAITFRALIFYQ